MHATFFQDLHSSSEDTSVQISTFKFQPDKPSARQQLTSILLFRDADNVTAVLNAVLTILRDEVIGRKLAHLLYDITFIIAFLHHSLTNQAFGNVISP